MRNKATLVYTATLILIILNVVTFCLAYPLMFQPALPTMARDFSAYYIGAWRLIHNPDKVYSWSPEPGDYPISPNAAGFKYTPSFLFLILPFTALDYKNAIVAFNLAQLALIPLLAFFVYKLVKEKDTRTAIIVSAIVLIQPLPAIIGGGDFPLSITLFYSYYMGWSHANAHILQTVLLVGAVYFSAKRKPLPSALLLSFGLLDPRAALVAAPLTLWYSYKNRQLKQFILYSFTLTAIENIPFLFYHNIFQSFLNANLNMDVVSQIYPYEWIPIYSITALSLTELATAIKNKNAILVKG